MNQMITHFRLSYTNLKAILNDLFSSGAGSESGARDQSETNRLRNTGWTNLELVNDSTIGSALVLNNKTM